MFVCSGLIKPHKGQQQADRGVIIMGYKGDPVLDNPNGQQRPPWTKDGSLMAFRKLQQDVPEFDTYLRKLGPTWRDRVYDPDSVQPPLSNEEGAELAGAQIVGRWKSVSVIELNDTRFRPSHAL